MMMRVLITGIAGMTGSHLVPPLTLCREQGGPGEAVLAVPPELWAEDGGDARVQPRGAPQGSSLCDQQLCQLECGR